MSTLTILGIDPGINKTGYGIIKIAENSQPQLYRYGHIGTDTKKSLAQRLHSIYTRLEEILKETQPDTIAIEGIFYSENVKTAIVMGHARGAAIVAGMNNNANIAEYSPREVKQSVVGNGGASKSQVRYMIGKLLNTREDIQPDDASDALAVALCHWHRLKFKNLTSV